LVKIPSGKVVSGTVVIEGSSLAEGSTVTNIAREDSEEFELGPADAAALREAIQQADDGQLVPASEVIASLKLAG
jgi:hypothetical protein